MKNTISLIISLCLFCPLFSQSELTRPEPTREFSLKLHAAFSANFESLLRYDASPLIPGIRMKTARGNIHQLELLHLVGNLKEALPNGTEDGFALGIRYEYAWALQELDLVDWKAFIGFGVLEAFSSWINEPSQSTSFSHRDRNNLVRLSFVPSIQYDLGDRLFLDFALPISFFDFQSEEKLTRTAPLGGSIDIVKNRQASLYLLRDLGLRFGIGLRL